MIDELDPQPGWIAPTVAEEFPELRLWWLPVDTREGKSTHDMKYRLGALSARTRGGTAMQLRNRPIPHAYRVFFRHIGLDPDVDRIPVEAIVVDRLVHGEYKPMSRINDALRIATIETEIPMWAIDADKVDGQLQIRGAYEREELEPGNPQVPWLPEGRLVVADPRGPISVLFSPVAKPRQVSDSTRRIILFTIQVKGVPSIYVSEAMWMVFDLLESANDG